MRKAAAIGATLVALFTAEARAHACGGCIHPNESPTVVTDHRMIFSISKEQSTLYDQIRYSGSPSSFGWVLPYSGEIEVGVSADVVFSVLDSQTATQIFAPPMNCPMPPTDCPFYPDGGISVSYTAGSDVNVLRRQVVGPYDIAQLQASSPSALTDWTTKNGFVIPEEAKPVIAKYQSEHFNFLAVKLIPTAGVQDMRPIRVTTKGANVALPLRMVAVGAGATLGLTLWVLSEGRSEPSNFPWFVINTDEIAWDWTANKSNYLDLRATKTAATGGRGWEIESSRTLIRAEAERMLTQGSFNPSTGVFVDGGASNDYDPVGNQTAEEVRSDDIAKLFGSAQGALRVTRMRADLSKTALDQDLTIGASADQSELANIRRLTREANEPECPVYDHCEQSGTAPRSQAAAKSAANNDDEGCSSTRSREGAGWMAAMLGFFAFTVSRKLRRRRF